MRGLFKDKLVPIKVFVMRSQNDFSKIIGLILIVCSSLLLANEIFAFLFIDIGERKFWTWEVGLMVLVLCCSLMNYFDKGS